MIVMIGDNAWTLKKLCLIKQSSDDSTYISHK